MKKSGIIVVVGGQPRSGKAESLSEAEERLRIRCDYRKNNRKGRSRKNWE